MREPIALRRRTAGSDATSKKYRRGVALDTSRHPATIATAEAVNERERTADSENPTSESER